MIYFLVPQTASLFWKFVPTMVKELSISQKKEWAQMLYLANQLTQKDIAHKVGTTEATMSKWAKAGNWDNLRKSLLTSKSEILRNLYNILDKLNKKLNEDEGFGDSKTADMYVKYTAAIKNLETETSIASLMDSGQKFHQYLQTIDPKFALDVLNHFDKFIKDQLKRFS